MFRVRSRLLENSVRRLQFHVQAEPVLLLMNASDE